jgi:serine-type D-Ala-D-Ala carboxypeptidase
MEVSTNAYFRWSFLRCCLGVALLAGPAKADEPPFPKQKIAEVVQAAIARKDLPGAVVLVLHKDKVLFKQAFGSRTLEPVVAPMTSDVIFDMASLTKPLATATSIMKLLEQGKLKLSDTVAQHWPDFGKHGKDNITIEHLLLHIGGLIADNPEKDYADGPQRSLERICDLKPVANPGARFIYSDVGFIVLGELVKRIAGKPLDLFAQEEIFMPLEMRDTGFLPLAGSALKPRERFAPTEKRGDKWMLGEVHDPRSYRLGGVAGHAGVFSTADDLARYARMILNGGELDGTRILNPRTVRTMTAPRPVPGGLRAYGWDVDTGYSSNRGELFRKGESFGHTGFTGTSIWIDPSTQTAVIFLSNRVHPNGHGNINRLRGQVATLAASALGYSK